MEEVRGLCQVEICDEAIAVMLWDDCDVVVEGLYHTRVSDYG